MAVAIDTAIQEYWQWREEMERRYVELYVEEIARRRMGYPETSGKGFLPALGKRSRVPLPSTSG